jgi:hypothetical protein
MSRQVARYLNSAAWRHCAEEALARAGFRCQVCHSTRKLRAYHQTYERLGEEAPDDLIVLCPNCRELYTRYGLLAHQMPAARRATIRPSDLLPAPPKRRFSRGSRVRTALTLLLGLIVLVIALSTGSLDIGAYTIKWGQPRPRITAAVGGAQLVTPLSPTQTAAPPPSTVAAMAPERTPTAVTSALTTALPPTTTASTAVAAIQPTVAITTALPDGPAVSTTTPSTITIPALRTGLIPPAAGTVDDGLWLMRQAVTIAQYQQCVDDGACTPPSDLRWPPGTEIDQAVTYVTWQQAAIFASYVGGRLPTAVEWTTACQASLFGEYDQARAVWEWTAAEETPTTVPIYEMSDCTTSRQQVADIAARRLGFRVVVDLSTSN